MDIYTTEPSSVESLVEEYKSLEGEVSMGTKARVQQCVYLAKIKDAMVAKYGSEKSKLYKKRSETIVSDLSITKANFRKLSQLGRFVLERNDSTWYDKTLDTIQKEMRAQSKSTTPKPRKKSKLESFQTIIEALRNKDPDAFDAWALNRCNVDVKGLLH